MFGSMYAFLISLNFALDRWHIVGLFRIALKISLMIRIIDFKKSFSLPLVLYELKLYGQLELSSTIVSSPSRDGHKVRLQYRHPLSLFVRCLSVVVQHFQRHLPQNCLANQRQISCKVEGFLFLYKWSRSHGQDGRHLSYINIVPTLYIFV